jgi:hypothetical protein
MGTAQKKFKHYLKIIPHTMHILQLLKLYRSLLELPDTHIALTTSISQII